MGPYCGCLTKEKTTKDKKNTAFYLVFTERGKMSDSVSKRLNVFVIYNAVIVTL